MSKPRSPGQTLIGVAVDEKLLAAIDKKRGGLTRSAFVRQAIGNFLGVAGDLLNAPDRTGKGGRPRKTSALSSRNLRDEHLPQVAEGGRKSPSPRKSKLKPVPGTGAPDEKAQVG